MKTVTIISTIFLFMSEMSPFSLWALYIKLYLISHLGKKKKKPSGKMNGKFSHLSEVFSSVPSPGWPWSSTLLQLSALIFKFHILEMQKYAFLEEAVYKIPLDLLSVSTILSKLDTAVSTAPVFAMQCTYFLYIRFRFSLAENLKKKFCLSLSLCLPR